MLVLNDKVPLMISKQLAQKYNAIPVDLQLNKLTVAISKENLYALEDLTMATGKEIIFKVEDEEKIKRSIEKYYSKMRYIEEDFSRQMIDNILQKAIILKSSDIHIEPFEHILKIRMRVDGSLKEINEYNIDMYSQLSTIIKLYSGMDIAEKRLPQDGRIDKAINGEVFDLRVSTIPTIYGEKIVIRILNRDILLKTKQDIGFSSQVESRVNSMLKSMSGLILITGPTGSGKTTTLYSIVNEFKDMDKNIVTIEDP
ncbi:MAG: GspE/PulE family protein, partial [Paraclostridium sp.]